MAGLAPSTASAHLWKIHGAATSCKVYPTQELTITL